MPSYEHEIESITRQIIEQKNRLLDEFFKAYAANLSHLPEFTLENICLIEQEPHFREGCVTRRYWFEYKPKFEEE